MKNTKFIQTLTGLIFAACIGSSLDLQADEAPQFEVTVLISNETEGYWYMVLAALNNKGEAVAKYSSPPGQSYVSGGLLIYPNATVINLTNLESCSYSDVSDLNDKTQIVGTCNQTAMVYTLAEGPVLLTNYESTASAINDAGQIVGGMVETGGSYQATVFLSNGTTINLGNLGNDNTFSSQAFDINDKYDKNGLGQVVGSSVTIAQPLFGQAFLYTSGIMSNIGQIVCTDQGSSALKINNKGKIAGYCVNGTEVLSFTGFTYESSTGAYTIFPDCPLDSINNAGWAVGNQDEPYGKPEGYLIIGEIMYNLKDLILPVFGVTDVQASDINDRGQILASTNLGTVLLTPVR